MKRILEMDVVFIAFLAIMLFAAGWLIGAVTSSKADTLRDTICQKSFGGYRSDQLCVKDGKIVFTFPEVK